MGADRPDFRRQSRPVTQRSVPPLRLLSAGAAKGLVEALAAPFEAGTGVRIEATFDAAGPIRDAFVSGVPCDVVILPEAMQDALAAQHRVDRSSMQALGCVPTGIAVADGAPTPSVHDAEQLRSTLDTASALYCPDTVRSTAGAHFAGVLRALGLYAQSLAKLRPYPNGARAMEALAQEAPHGAIGCTQMTEILYTRGVWFAGSLPPPFDLATTYAIAVASNTDKRSPAHAFVAHLAGPETESLRRAGGFIERSTAPAVIR
jgi:molybdate transport system substrate-binding protein